MLQKYIKQVNWYDFYNVSNINERTNCFIKTINNIIKKSFIIVRVKHKECKRKYCIAKDLINSIITRDRLYQLQQKNPNNAILKISLSVVGT